MSRNDYIREVKGLPAPSKEQINNFIKYIMGAHSWYKHLGIISGVRVIYFLAEDVGGGYTKENPRLHYSWETRDEYISRFGYLDYQYDNNGDFRRDVVSARARDEDGFPLIKLARDYVKLPDDVIELTSMTLYPYASNKSTAHRMFNRRGVKSILNGSEHPDRDLIIDWYEHGVNWKLARDCEDVRGSLKKWKESKKDLLAVYAKLQNTQEEKISKAIDNLQEWVAGVK